MVIRRQTDPLSGTSNTRPTLELSNLMAPPPWMRDAACAEHPELSFFPGLGEPTEAAVLICSACLVREECAAYAIEHAIEHGIWGGTSARQRRLQRKAAQT